MRRRGHGAAKLLIQGDALNQRHARTPVLVGQQEPNEVELAQLLPQGGGVANRVVLHLADDVEWAMTGQDVARRLAQELLFLVEVEIKHEVPLSWSASEVRVRRS